MTRKQFNKIVDTQNKLYLSYLIKNLDFNKSRFRLEIWPDKKKLFRSIVYTK